MRAGLDENRFASGGPAGDDVRDPVSNHEAFGKSNVEVASRPQQKARARLSAFARFPIRRKSRVRVMGAEVEPVEPRRPACNEHPFDFFLEVDYVPFSEYSTSDSSLIAYDDQEKTALSELEKRARNA